jgi:hypothetical protein
MLGPSTSWTHANAAARDSSLQTTYAGGGGGGVVVGVVVVVRPTGGGGEPQPQLAVCKHVHQHMQDD